MEKVEVEIKLDDEAHAFLEEMAAKNNCTLDDFLNKILEEEMAKSFSVDDT